MKASPMKASSLASAWALLLGIGLGLASIAQGADNARANDYGSSSSGAAPRYTFSWPLDGDAVKPRGGTTAGAPVTLDRNPSAAWTALQEQNLSALERDRRAILAMAGTYRVTFDFLEVVSYTAPDRSPSAASAGAQERPRDKPAAPYQSWATEKVYVDEDAGQTISLVHILEMRFVQQDGSISEPMVTKHWRQDWRYEPQEIVEYRGRDRWQQRKLGATGKGAWLQAVYQVDESPRYASIGRWEHTPSFSTWLGAETWRPLPRREWSVRDDYQVLLGTNRHTIQFSGWIQEENNLKTVVATVGVPDARLPFVAREYGVARYERIRDADFAAADAYYSATKQFWRDVRATWRDTFAREGGVTLRGPVDKLGLFVPLFERAEQLAAEPREQGNHDKNQQVIAAALRDMGALK